MIHEPGVVLTIITGLTTSTNKYLRQPIILHTPAILKDVTHSWTITSRKLTCKLLIGKLQSSHMTTLLKLALNLLSLILHVSPNVSLFFFLIYQ